MNDSQDFFVPFVVFFSFSKRPFAQWLDHYDSSRRLCCFTLLSPIIVWHMIIIIHAITGINVTNHRVNGRLRTRHEPCLADQETARYSYVYAAERARCP